MKVLDVLKATRSILEKPERWTQGASARNAVGHVVNFADSDAVCWCLTGAIQKAVYGDIDVLVLDAMNYAFNEIDRTLGYSGILGWNDWPLRTHDEVLELLDSTIDRLGCENG